MCALIAPQLLIFGDVVSNAMQNAVNPRVQIDLHIL